MTATATRVCALYAESTPLDDVRQLIPFLDARHPLLWSRKGQGLAGAGEALRLEFRGPDRIARAAATWREIAAAAHVDDAVHAPGSGLVAFGAFAFAAESDETSVLVVPEVVLGRRDGRCWITRIRRLDEDTLPATPQPTPFGEEYRLALLPGRMDADRYREAVAESVRRIDAGALRKVVLARDLVGRLPRESDVRLALVELALGYPDCWSFAVDGLVGSSPETLIHVAGGRLDARVLAGTVSRGVDADGDRLAVAGLTASAKDRDEHRFAVQSVLEALAPHTAALASSPTPTALKLPNLWHLATELDGTLADGSSALDLVAALHPTAAVAGTPTAEAERLIAELEPFDRGRYAGPVGWVDAHGDGEWAIALRCAQLADDGELRAYAGAGIVAGSEPEREYAETTMKLRPIVEAFG